MKNEPLEVLSTPTTAQPNALTLAAFVAVIAMICGYLPTAMADHVQHNVAAGMIRVDQILPGFPPAPQDDNTNCQASLTLSVNDFRLVGNVNNRADFTTQIGTAASDDSTTGIMMSSVAQNIRANYGTNVFSTPAWVVASGGFRLTPWACNNGAQGYEYNVNVAGAWFPYSNWLGGWARNIGGANGGSNDLFTSSPQIVVGTHFIPLYDTNNAAATRGRSIVDFTSLGIDARTDGIMLVTHAKEEANYAMSTVNSNTGTWTLYVKDNGDDAGANAYEQDPISFVYVPRTNTTVVSGRVMTDSGGNPSIVMFSGASPQFTVTRIATGRWELKVNGRSPTNGVLIVSAEGGGAFNLDNVVTYDFNAAGDGWEIQSRDLPAGGLQNPHASDNGPEGAFSFVYIPVNLPGVTVSPTNNLLTTETAGTAQFNVVLDAPPFANVDIPISSSDTTEGLPNTNLLTFTPANWNVPQTVIVTGQDDLLADGPIPYTIVLGAISSTDTRYNGINPDDVSVVNADNEPGITLSKASLITTEAGGTDNFTIVLNQPPTDDVTIGLSSSNTGEGTVSPSSVTFTPLNWSNAQPVTVTGVNDDVADGNVAYTVITAPAVSNDPIYNGVNANDIPAVNINDDVAGYSFSTTSVTVSESGTAAIINISLTSKPTNNVTINITSSDTTEGVVSPSSLTFTPATWNVTQSYTNTGVDDFVMDGNIIYTNVTTVTSGDAVYAALNPPDVTATTLDNEAQIVLPSGTMYYGIGDPGRGLDGHASLTDPDTADYNGGSLTITVTANGVAGDRLEIRNDGTGPGQIGVSGSSVTYGGTGIGTFAGGVGVNPLVVSFNAFSSPAAAQDLLRAITYRRIGGSSNAETRTVSIALAGGDGGTSTVTKQIKLQVLRVYDYQQGADYGYGLYYSAVDNEIAPPPNDNRSYTNGFSGPSGLWLDYVTTDNPQVLLRFTNLFGGNPGQIPLGAKIVSAQLIVDVNDSGDGGTFYRMLIPWDSETETWNTIGGGVQTDDLEARSTFDSFWGVPDATGGTTVGTVPIGVTLDIQAWADGAANFGWFMKPWDFASDGTGFSHCEWTNVDNRPRLHVLWLPADIQSVSLRQNVNNYTNAFDTRVRQNAPTTDFSTATALYSDWAVTGSSDNEQVLIKFDSLIGNDTNQVPAGATVYAAVLDLVSIVVNAPGDGGTFHTLLQPWQDTTSTWDSWVNGIQADNVEASTTVSAQLGSASLTPDVQATINTVDLTSDVQAWVNGTPNYGWVVLPLTGGSDGWGWASDEAAEERTRPQLRVYYAANAVVGPIVIQNIQRTASTAVITFSGTVGTQYTVLRSGTVNGTYTSAGTATVQPGGTATFTDNAPLPGAAFYRISYP